MFSVWQFIANSSDTKLRLERGAFRTRINRIASLDGDLLFGSLYLECAERLV